MAKKNNGTKRRSAAHPKVRGGSGTATASDSVPQLAWRELKTIYAILDRRFDGGDPGLAGWHVVRRPVS